MICIINNQTDSKRGQNKFVFTFVWGLISNIFNKSNKLMNFVLRWHQNICTFSYSLYKIVIKIESKIRDYHWFKWMICWRLIWLLSESIGQSGRALPTSEATVLWVVWLWRQVWDSFGERPATDLFNTSHYCQYYKRHNLWVIDQNIKNLFSLIIIIFTKAIVPEMHIIWI